MRHQNGSVEEEQGELGRGEGEAPRGLIVKITRLLDNDELLQVYARNMDLAKEELTNRLIYRSETQVKKESKLWDGVFLMLISIVPLFFMLFLSWVCENDFEYAGLPFLVPILVLVYWAVLSVYAKLFSINRGIGGFAARWGFVVTFLVGVPILLSSASVVALMIEDYNLAYTSTLFAVAVFPFGAFFVILPFFGFLAALIWYFYEKCRPTRRESDNSIFAGGLTWALLFLSVWLAGCSLAFFVLLAQHKWGEPDSSSGGTEDELPTWDNVFIPVWVFEAIALVVFLFLTIHSRLSATVSSSKRTLWPVILAVCALLTGFSVLVWLKLERRIHTSFMVVFVPADVAGLLIAVFSWKAVLRKYFKFYEDSDNHSSSGSDTEPLYRG